MLLQLSVTVLLIVNCAFAQRFNLGCNPSQGFLASTRSCISCPTGSTFQASSQKCVCNSPAIASDDSTNSFTCITCSDSSSMAGRAGTGGSLTCLQCSSNATSTIATLSGAGSFIVNSTWSDTAAACVCPSGYYLTNVLDVVYASWFCVRCSNATTAASTACTPHCASPLVYDTTLLSCVCPSGFSSFQTSFGTTCVATTTVNALLSGISLSDMSLSPPNLQNSGSSGGAFTSVLLQSTYLSSTVGCSRGNATACNALANLCVLSLYNIRKPACALYRQLQQRENCRGLSCETPTSVPWLYYLRSSADILHDTSINLQVALQSQAGKFQRLRFVVAQYAMNGTFLGHAVVTDDLSTCEIPAAFAREFWAVGARREVSCNINLRWFFNAPDTIMYELFLQNADSSLFPVPAMLVYDNTDVKPDNIDDDVIVTSASTSGDPVSNCYKRRFYVYDNYGSRGADGTIGYVTYARRMTVMVNLRPGHNSQIYTPLLIIQYASVLGSAALPFVDTADGELRHLRTNVSKGALTDVGVDKVLYVQSTDQAVYAAQTTVIVLTSVMLLTAFARTYGWMRRQQDLVMGLGTLWRFVLYYFNHLANMFILFDICFCAVFYIFFKYQSSVDYLLPEDAVYVYATLYTACVMKGIVVLAKIYEQCNADIFVIDWERSKGQLKHSDVELPVSMWRSTFIANEFNEMQIKRGWNVIFTMFVVTAFLDGLNYINLAKSVPETSDGTDAYTTTHPLLRIAVCSFFWIVVAFVLHILEYQLWYRFMETHPLQAFVDLCSVSNISIMVLLEPQWGFYIHGESIHAYADASMEEFQRNLEQEAQGNLPTRGINGTENCQTFEVFLGMYMRQFLNVSYHQLFTEQQQRTLIPRPVTGQQGCFEFLRNRFQVALTPETLAIKRKINSAFQASVREARRSVLAKFGVHAMIDFPPNILYLNGPFAGEKAGGDLFFMDDFKCWSKTLLYGIDLDIFILYVILFLSLDTALQNVFGSMALTYLVEICIVTYRQKEGEANIARKTMFDDRFFL